MGAFAFELAVVMLTAALIGIMYHEDFYRGPIPPEAQAACPEHLKELCRMPINDHIMPRANVAVLGISLIGCMVSLDVFGADVAVARRYQSWGLPVLPYAIGGFGVHSAILTLPPLVYSIIFRQLVTPPQTFAEDYEWSFAVYWTASAFGYFGSVAVAREKSQVCAVFLVLSAFVFSGAPLRLPELRRVLGDFIYEVATSSSYIRWALEAAYIQEAVYHQRSYDVSGGMEFFGMVMGNRGRDLAWIFAIGAVFRVATYAALLARQPTSSWRKGALSGRVRATLAAGRRAPAGHVELAEVEVGRDSPAGARAEKVEHV